MIQLHNDPPNGNEITYYKLRQKIYFDNPDNYLEMDRLGPFKTSPEGLMLVIESTSKINLANKSFALEMGDSSYTQIIIVKE